MHTHSHRSHPKPIRKQNQKAMYKSKRKYHQTKKKKSPIIQVSLFNVDLLLSTVANEAGLNCGFYTRWYLHIFEWFMKPLSLQLLDFDPVNCLKQLTMVSCSADLKSELGDNYTHCENSQT